MKLEKGVTVIVKGKHYKNVVPDRLLMDREGKDAALMIEKANKKRAEYLNSLETEGEIKANEEENIDKYIKKEKK